MTSSQTPERWCNAPESGKISKLVRVEAADSRWAAHALEVEVVWKYRLIKYLYSVETRWADHVLENVSLSMGNIRLLKLKPWMGSP